MKAIKYLLFGISLLLAGILAVLLTLAGNSVACIIIACICGAGGIFMCVFGIKTPVYKDAEFNNFQIKNDAKKDNHKDKNN